MSRHNNHNTYIYIQYIILMCIDMCIYIYYILLCVCVEVLVKLLQGAIPSHHLGAFKPSQVVIFQ